jgi:hypothetical protein
VIGASNREDMIDPAILRPGPAGREDQDRAARRESRRDIFSKYLVPELPLHATTSRSSAATGRLRVGDDPAHRRADVHRVEENRFLEVTYANGDKEVLYFKDFNSGAMIQNIVDRAKKMAIKDFIEHQPQGAAGQHLLQACVDEFKENEDLPNTTNPDDWARISGKKGERIVFIRTLISGKQGSEPGARSTPSPTRGSTCRTAPPSLTNALGPPPSLSRWRTGWTCARWATTIRRRRPGGRGAARSTCAATAGRTPPRSRLDVRAAGRSLVWSTWTVSPSPWAAGAGTRSVGRACPAHAQRRSSACT